MSGAVRLVDHGEPAVGQPEGSGRAGLPPRLLGALARKIVESLPASEVTTVSAGSGGAVLLYLEDLVADEGGELVLRHGGGETSVLLLSPERPVELGRAVPHITAAGENVSDCRYARFASGLVLYYPCHLTLDIVHLAADDA